LGISDVGDWREVALVWYQAMSVFYLTLAGPLRQVADSSGSAGTAVFVFGLIGATAPCQLTTNAAALAYVARQSGKGRAAAISAGAYLAAKAFAYTVLGLAVVLVGREFSAQASIPAIVIARKALGPSMLLIGLQFLGVIRLPFGFGRGLAARVESRLPVGPAGGFLLGLAFSAAFCPTLFFLFFGLTIPLALSSPLGVVYPALFALGTTAPLLGLAGLLAAGANALKGYLAGARRLNAWLRPAAGLVFLAAGVNDSLTYWLL
jgi:hypothetical protein